MIHATELMIGDWVYIFDPDYKEEKKAYKVSEIRKDGIRTYMFNDTYEEGWFEPIPLTPEIFEKNGFCVLTRDTDIKSYYLCYREDTALDDDLRQYYIIDIHNDLCFLSISDIRFVHELQRVLRCCGLNELADNLKAE